MNRTVYVVLPGSVDDPATPSGGNRYDRRVCDGLLRTWDVHEIAVAGAWPHPSAAARGALAGALAAVPDGSSVLLDGLVACAVPEVLEPVASRLRLVVLVHLPLSDEIGLAPGEADALRALERRALHAAAAIIATSAGAARRLVGLHNLPADRVHTAAPGVDTAPLAAATPAGGRLLCVAAVTPRKAQDVLLDALATVGDLAWSCVCVGTLDRAPDFAAALAERATDLRSGAPAGHRNGGDRVRFVGTRTGAELAATYAAADLLVLPSRAEPYGMVVTEALAHGIPVLATAVDGVPEALGAAPDGSVPGVLVPPGDVGALAAAIRRWLTDAAWRGRMRASARARRDNLRGWDETIRKVSEVLSA
ncbi:MAG TPA: glycosyltransferase family 4 protein [Actinoplanes sp.]|nr:glycosyltransferase family 4 protein [Actinoplanes sp.]